MKQSLLWMVLAIFVLAVAPDFSFAQGVSKKKTFQQAQKELAPLKAKTSSIKKGEFEKTADFEARKSKLKRKIDREIYGLLRPSYPATAKVTFGNYNADKELLSLAVENVEEDLFLKVEPVEAKYLKNNSSKVKATGSFWLEEDGEIFLAEPLKLTVGSKTYKSLPPSGIHFVRLPVYVEGYISAFSPDGGKFLTVTGNEATMWDLNTITVIRRFLCRGKPIFSPDGKSIAIPRDNNIDLLDVASGEAIKSIRYSQLYGEIYTAVFSPTNHLIALQDRGAQAITLADVQSGQEVKRVKDYEAGGCSFSSDGSLLALGPVIYDVRSLKPLWRVEAGSITFCGESNIIAGRVSTGFWDGIGLWDAVSHQELGRIGSEFFVYRIEVSSDGQILLGVTQVSAVICSVEPFKKLRVIAVSSFYPNQPVDVTLSPDGSMLAIGNRLYEIIRPGRENQLLSTSFSESGFRLQDEAEKQRLDKDD